MTNINFCEIKTGETFIHNDTPYRKVPSQFDKNTQPVGDTSSMWANSVSRPEHKSFSFAKNVQVTRLAVH